YQVDIAGSIAHVTMLGNTNIVSKEEALQITDGLESIRDEISSGTFEWSIGLEDVHMNIEAALIEKIGDVGKKLHTGRSRNDQVATDIRLYLRSEIDSLCEAIRQVQHGVVSLAENETETIMPGFTHMQTAQPISFAHHLMAWYEMLQRDFERMQDCRKRVNICPLGAAALAGTSFPIDREMTAQLLGFDKPAANSLDAVSDRDFAMEFCAAASLVMTHLSRMSEELVIWTSAQFDFIELPEIVRGKTGRVYGHLVSLLTLMKAQPLAYNKDNQEDKEPLFDTLDTVNDCLKAFADMIPAIKSKGGNMRDSALKGFS
ncbi:MAG: argininosuccinate lyase, partial [Pseudomonadales bacterium]